MKQRLGIARALLGRPKLLMLDEPTNGLDPRGMREMRELVRSLALHDRITVFLSSHLLAEVQAICNRVGIIHAGRLRAEGRVDQLLDQAADNHLVEVASADAAALRDAVDAFDGAEAIGPGTHGRLLVRLISRPSEGPCSPSDLNRVLAQAGVHLSALVPTERNLEDVFLEVTR
jgi:ABC-2 type transport system ATP-binding protein